MSQLVPEQVEFIRNISDDSVEIKDIIVAGMHQYHVFSNLFRNSNTTI